MRKIISILLLLGLCLAGCAKKETTPVQTTETSTIVQETTLATAPSKPVEVSSLAQEDFLDLDNASYPRENPVEFVMLHFTSAVMLDRENPFDYSLVRGIFEENKLGIHYIIDRDGKIFCFVPESRSAWHAGRGSYGEEKYTDNMNRYSIGIELMAIGSEADMSIYMHPEEYAQLPNSVKGFTQAQYASLASLVQDICARHELPMNREHIIGHQQYSPAKNDPGELCDWAQFMTLLG